MNVEPNLLTLLMSVVEVPKEGCRVRERGVCRNKAAAKFVLPEITAMGLYQNAILAPVRV